MALLILKNEVAVEILPVGSGENLTQHLADVWLDVHILEVLVGVSVVETQGGVQPDRHPHTVSDPRQLPHLALPARVGVERLLRSSKSAHYYSCNAPQWLLLRQKKAKADGVMT